MFKRLLSVCMIFGMAATAPPAAAGTCTERSKLIERLSEKYAENLTAGGIRSGRKGNALFEIWSSEETGTFTLLVTYPNGVSCVVAAGTDFFDTLPAKMPLGTPG